MATLFLAILLSSTILIGTILMASVAADPGVPPYLGWGFGAFVMFLPTFLLQWVVLAIHIYWRRKRPANLIVQFLRLIVLYLAIVFVFLAIDRSNDSASLEQMLEMLAAGGALAILAGIASTVVFRGVEALLTRRVYGSSR